MSEVLDSVACVKPAVPDLPAEAVNRRRMARFIEVIRREPGLEIFECPVFHEFPQPGIYCRCMFVPAGTLVVGAIHKFETMFTVAEGCAELRGDGDPRRICAPMQWVSPPGVQRAVFALTDCVFISTLRTHLKDPELIRRTFVAENFIEYEQHLLENHSQEA